MKDRIVSAFLSAQPFEPVLVFASENDAQNFRLQCSTARINSEHPKWVYMPMPAGLLRSRTAQRGDVAFEFGTAEQARMWNGQIKDVGTIETAVPHRPDWNRTVYLGKVLKW